MLWPVSSIEVKVDCSWYKARTTPPPDPAIDLESYPLDTHTEVSVKKLSRGSKTFIELKLVSVIKVLLHYNTQMDLGADSTPNMYLTIELSCNNYAQLSWYCFNAKIVILKNILLTENYILTIWIRSVILVAQIRVVISENSELLWIISK